MSQTVPLMGSLRPRMRDASRGGGNLGARDGAVPVQVPQPGRQEGQGFGPRGLSRRVGGGTLRGPPALDAGGRQALQELHRGVDRFYPFTEERAGFANAIFASSHPAPWDGEGRVILPDRFLEHAGIVDRALFVGLGDTFQIWEPDRYDDVEREALALARRQRAALAVQPAGTGGER
ncbi:MAG: hypothetical protein J4F33_11860 [Alphaproteobacteria bacterium]|nr:hypothetical protein [Alphaproteobacteria bacterium]